MISFVPGAILLASLRALFASRILRQAFDEP